LELAREFETALANEPDTVRFGRNVEPPRVEPAITPPQSYETRVSSPTSTDEMEQSDQATTDLLGRAKVTAEQGKLKPETARQKGPTSDLGDQTTQPTELLQRSAAPAEKALVEKEDSKSVRITALQADEEFAERAEPDPLRADPIGQTARSDEPEKKQAAVPAPPIVKPIVKPLVKPAAAPAAKSKPLLLIGAGVALAALIGVGALLFGSGKSKTERQTTTTATPSPVAATSPSPSASSAYPNVVAPEGMAYVIGGVLRVGRDDG